METFTDVPRSADDNEFELYERMASQEAFNLYDNEHTASISLKFDNDDKEQEKPQQEPLRKMFHYLH